MARQGDWLSNYLLYILLHGREVVNYKDYINTTLAWSIEQIVVSGFAVAVSVDVYQHIDGSDI